MPSSRFTYLWIQDGIPARRLLGGPLVPLEERLSALAEDDSASVEALVLQAAEIVFGWALEHDESWTSERAGLDLESGVADLEARHGWRGPLALLLDSLRQAWSATSGDDALGPRAALSEEAGLWIWSQREDVERWPDLAGGPARRSCPDGVSPRAPSSHATRRPSSSRARPCSRAASARRSCRR